MSQDASEVRTIRIPEVEYRKMRVAAALEGESFQGWAVRILREALGKYRNLELRRAKK